MRITTLFRMAVRGMGRNRYRTAITVIAIGFSGGIMIFYFSLMAGLRFMMEQNAVELNMGQIQLHATGYRLDPNLYNLIGDAPSQLRRLEEAGFNAAPRIYSVGLSAADNKSAGVTLRGIDLMREPTVTKLHRHLQEGSWLNANDPKGVVIGTKLARALSAGVGKQIVILSQAADGGMANDLYVVRGILKATAEEIDLSAIFMGEQPFRALILLEEGVHEIALMPKTNNPIDLTEAVAKVTALAPGLEVKSWRALQPAIARILDLNKIAFNIILTIAYIAVGLTTLNAMLMSVFERIPEIGIMKALGVTPTQIVTLLFIEAGVIAGMALPLAFIVGFPLAFYYQQHGIDLSILMKRATISGIAFDPILYPVVSGLAVFIPLSVLLVIVGLSVIYPSLKGARINPVEAIDHL